MEIETFKDLGITYNQFYGIDKIDGDLCLDYLTSIPDGFNRLLKPIQTYTF